VKIFHSADAAVPGEVQDGLQAALAASINHTNRTNKEKKFAFETSEDAITWTVFRGLQREHLLRATLHTLGLVGVQRDGEEPALLLWGAAIPPDNVHVAAARDNLLSVSDRLGEDANRRTEPDVVLDFGDAGIVVIEVKHRSGNEYKPTGRSSRYVSSAICFPDPAATQSSGLYELARNWRIGHEMAGDWPFVLINLGPQTLFTDDRLSRFVASLRTSKSRRFLTVGWNQLITAAELPDRHYIRAFLRERGVGVTPAPA
jgi:hypothetical protein